MFTNIVVFLLTSLVFTLLLLFFAYEQKHGQRVFLVRLRRAVDTICLHIYQKIHSVYTVLFRFVFSLTWRTVVHALLRGILSRIAIFYEKLVSYFEYNHKKTRTLKRAKKAWQKGDSSYFVQIKEHQKQSKLSVAEKHNRKQKALEG